ncbi:unnamed protein product [Didymodactylos carnosus]|uniref:G domain-containing protein n=1 Tax=Didymodactylos carnosus TaxID=1234261 RepID=A0A815YYY3_9BILA|nr:unnamed protein product [Didymodactylos carnosus]CAF1576745.1 unnamed protein product [Didymodactylos carnosus]CAF4122088.1 unnamed protein product [Didymodactylos carnosus]CAF4442065.1 unnamed protein product [Didymodactylos carnosus]
MAALSNEINDELVSEEDEQHEQDQVELDLIEYLRNKLVELRSKISSEFEILVFGPARVGKSTLIKQVSGDDTIETSAEMNACTTKTEKHMDKYNIFWWDTPGLGALEILDDIGIPVVESTLNEQENEIYKQVKNGENPLMKTGASLLPLATPVAAAVMRAMVDKLFSSNN